MHDFLWFLKNPVLESSLFWKASISWRRAIENNTFQKVIISGVWHFDDVVHVGPNLFFCFTFPFHFRKPARRIPKHSSGNYLQSTVLNHIDISLTCALVSQYLVPGKVFWTCIIIFPVGISSRDTFMRNSSIGKSISTSYDFWSHPHLWFGRPLLWTDMEQ